MGACSGLCCLLQSAPTHISVVSAIRVKESLFPLSMAPEEIITLPPHNVSVSMPDGNYYIPQIIIHYAGPPHKYWQLYYARY